MALALTRGDLAEYDEICSLQRGNDLALQAAAAATREQEEKALKTLLLLQQNAPATVPPGSPQLTKSDVSTAPPVTPQ